MTAYEFGYWKNDLTGSLSGLKEVASVHPSRELSLAITNLEQALMWFEKIVVSE